MDAGIKILAIFHLDIDAKWFENLTNKCKFCNEDLEWEKW